MSKKDVLESISEEILSRSILSKEDIEGIISARLDFLLTEIAKNKLNSYEKKQRKLHDNLGKCNSKMEADGVKRQLQTNKLMKKQFNIIVSETKKQNEYLMLKTFLREKGENDLLEEFFSTLN